MASSIHIDSSRFNQLNCYGMLTLFFTGFTFRSPWSKDAERAISQSEISRLRKESCVRARSCCIRNCDVVFQLVIPDGCEKCLYLFQCCFWYAGGKRDQYPLRNVTSPPSAFQQKRGERNFLCRKIDWHWASVVCDDSRRRKRETHWLGVGNVSTARMINLWSRLMPPQTALKLIRKTFLSISMLRGSLYPSTRRVSLDLS